VKLFETHHHLLWCVQTAAALLLAELHDPNSKYKPYLASLPSKGEVHSYYSFPKPYLQLIDNEHLVRGALTALAGDPPPQASWQAAPGAAFPMS
jgi:hypothetical protein